MTGFALGVLVGVVGAFAGGALLLLGPLFLAELVHGRSRRRTGR